MSYAAAYIGTKPVIRLSAGAGTQSPPWVRPADWMPLPAPASNEQVFKGIYGVSNDEANYVALLATTSAGSYQVDWGDGTIEVFASNVRAEHLYSWSNPALGSPKSDGFKQAMVTVTPLTGNLTSINLQQRFALTGLSNAYKVNWLDIAINGSAINSLTVGGSTVRLAELRKAFIGVVSVTSFASLFESCVRLSVISAIGSNAAVTNMSSMFSGCASLQTIPAFPGSVAAVTNMSFMFQNCSSLQTIPAFPGSVAAVTNMSNMFQNCSSLQTIPAFPGSVAAVTNMSNMFSGCASLQTIPAFPGSVAAVTNMSFMFQNCSSLQTIPAFPGSVAAVTNMSFMFNGCSSLQTIPAFETEGISSSSNASSMFAGCHSLTNGRTNGIRFSISYQGCKLSSAELNEIFTGLGTASGTQTISVSLNFGFAGCNQSIATAKGWTVN